MKKQPAKKIRVALPGGKATKVVVADDMASFVEGENLKGFLTVAQAAAKLGVQEEILRGMEIRHFISGQLCVGPGSVLVRLYKREDVVRLKAELPPKRFGKPAPLRGTSPTAVLYDDVEGKWGEKGKTARSRRKSPLSKKKARGG